MCHHAPEPLTAGYVHIIYTALFKALTKTHTYYAEMNKNTSQFVLKTEHHSRQQGSFMAGKVLYSEEFSRRFEFDASPLLNI